jgi:hypothetical protein
MVRVWRFVVEANGLVVRRGTAETQFHHHPGRCVLGEEPRYDNPILGR